MLTVIAVLAAALHGVSESRPERLIGPQPMGSARGDAVVWMFIITDHGIATNYAPAGECRDAQELVAIGVPMVLDLEDGAQAKIQDIGCLHE